MHKASHKHTVRPHGHTLTQTPCIHKVTHCVFGHTMTVLCTWRHTHVRHTRASQSQQQNSTNTLELPLSHTRGPFWSVAVQPAHHHHATAQRTLCTATRKGVYSTSTVAQRTLRTATNINARKRSTASQPASQPSSVTSRNTVLLLSATVLLLLSFQMCAPKAQPPPRPSQPAQVHETVHLGAHPYIPAHRSRCMCKYLQRPQSPPSRSVSVALLGG